MEDAHRTWLLACADRLTAGRDGPVQMRALLAHLGVALEKVVATGGPDGGRAHEASVARDAHGRYHITLVRLTAEATPLSVRERFTLAHELGHVLLDMRTRWQPTSTADYYRREAWCDQFAARLLVPSAALEVVRVDAPRRVLDAVVFLRRVYRVSTEVAARRLVDAHAAVTVLQCERVRTGDAAPTVRVRWAATRDTSRRLTRGRHLPPTDALARALLADELHGALYWGSPATPTAGRPRRRGASDPPSKPAPASACGPAPDAPPAPLGELGRGTMVYAAIRTSAGRPRSGTPPTPPAEPLLLAALTATGDADASGARAPTPPGSRVLAGDRCIGTLRGASA